MTFGDLAQERTKGLQRRGEDASYDYALPQSWFNDVSDVTKQNPSGHIVWLYDDLAPSFGRPFAVTLKGWILLRIAAITFN